MKTTLALLMAVAFTGSSFAAATSPANGRTITELNVISKRVLARAISPKFYDTLLISPVSGWVTVRSHLVGTGLFGSRIVRSDLGGEFDALALQRTKEIKVLRHFKVDTQSPATTVLLHLLIYKIADGTLALSFATIDEAGGDQLDYFGCAKLAVLKDDGSWTEIKGPSTLEGKGVMVRAPGVKNNREALYLLERVISN